ncbi:MAG: UDP-N-acetylmuramate--L-alanine ligase [Sphingomonadales bacterium]|nr:UDP-N-acetylmuramate--L-alanine ligase [Sphingomonadales bacterium]
MNLNEIKHAYFLGIGGIGMSAIARYLKSRGIVVSGYDKTPSELTDALQKEGVDITFEDSIATLPSCIATSPESVLLVYTPAIPADHIQLNHLRDNGYSLYKRSEVLGIISKDAFCIAVAGTHGKTTTSTLIAHLLYECNVNFAAFLGGISANYGTNYINQTSGREIFPDKPVIILEADEFDRSFHRLNPDTAIITAIDPDHLDIYENEEAFREAFRIFAGKIKSGGQIIYHHSLKETWPAQIQCTAYGTQANVVPSVACNNIITSEGTFHFDITISNENIHKTLPGWQSGLPGFHNVENATAAVAACLNLPGILKADLRSGVSSYRGAKRRFEYVVKTPDYIVIDDYAHHPQELNAIIGSVKALHPNKAITGIFQPHLFTRTRDFADGFAESLDKLDNPILLDIYPARELPIPGITSDWLLDKMKNSAKKRMENKEVIEFIKKTKPSLLLILGAGDIDRLVPVIKEIYHGI